MKFGVQELCGFFHGNVYLDSKDKYIKLIEAFILSNSTLSPSARAHTRTHAHTLLCLEFDLDRWSSRMILFGCGETKPILPYSISLLQLQTVSLLYIGLGPKEL